MKAVLLSDLMVIKSQAKSVLLVLVVWLAITIYNKSGLFFSALSVVYAMMLPLTCIAAYEKSCFDRYLLTAPVGRAAAAFALEIAASAVLRWPLWELYRPALVALYIGCALLSLALPAAYKFGFAVARAACVPPLLAVIAVFAIWPSDWAKTPGAVLIAAPAAAIAAAWGSALSVGIYRKKEF